MTDHDHYDDLIARVRARAAERCGPLPAPVSRRVLHGVECALGFALHPLLARLYLEVADGGFGPDSRLFALDGPATGKGDQGPVTSAYAARRAADRDDPGWFWPEGVVPVLSWGCGMLAAVDCRSTAGTVLLFDPNAVDHEWADAWFEDAGSLAEWLETSLSGRGWYVDPQEPDEWGQHPGILTEDQLQPVQLAGWHHQARSRAVF